MGVGAWLAARRAEKHAGTLDLQLRFDIEAAAGQALLGRLWRMDAVVLQ